MHRLTFVISNAAVGLALVSAPILCAAQTAPAANSQASGASSLSSADRKFVNEAAQGGMAEVELGRLATQKAFSDSVKQFGQRMVDDHSKANDQLKQIASSKGVDLPEGLSAKDKATVSRLSKLNGADFDRAYMADMVKDHKKDVAVFQHESTAGADPDIKNFAAQTLPTLQDHLSQAQKTSPSMAMSKPSSGDSAMPSTR